FRHAAGHRAHRHRTAGVVHQHQRGGGGLVVAGPHALAAAVDRVVEHAVGGQRTVAEHIHHQRPALAGCVFQAGADAFAGTDVAQLARGALAGVVVEAAHLDGARAGIAVDDHLHHRGGLAEFAVAVVFGLAPDAVGSDDV